MRVAIIGAVESTRVALWAMKGAGVAPAAIVTLPLEKAARHSDFVDLRPVAAQMRVPVIETAQVNAGEVLNALRGLALDYLFVIGWSQILSRELLELARHGTIGYHPAPLPEMRGRAVIPWTILTGRETTGSTLFWIDEGTDTGDILAQEVFPVAGDETSRSLYKKHMDSLGRMLERSLPELAAGRAARHVQDHALATWCARRTPADGVIEWRAPALVVERLIRAVGEPYPGAVTFSGGRRVIVWSAVHVPAAPHFGTPGQIVELGPSGALVSCGGGGFVRLVDVQMDGGQRVRPADVLKVHERLGLDVEQLWRALAQAGAR